jgi:hypothetical protein
MTIMVVMMSMVMVPVVMTIGPVRIVTIVVRKHIEYG